MSPPSVWGPPVWTLFHTLIEKLNPDPCYYDVVAPKLFKYFVRICKYLPCPTCSEDAGRFLANISYVNCNNKTSFMNTFYLFHNYVNRKKRKQLFNYADINVYQNYKILDVVNNFLKVYNTKGNMQMLTETFHRELLVKEFKQWLKTYLNGFLLPKLNNTTIPTTNSEEETKREENKEEGEES